MESLHLTTLAACDEMIRRQNEILPYLANALKLETNGIFYEWAFRRISQTGSFLDNQWRYFFHGYECDIENLLDGRFLRIDFGPGGSTETFTGYGVLQFVMTTKSPWADFDRLKRFLAVANAPYNRFSGDHSKISDICDKLFNEGLIEVADKSLIEFEKLHTTVQANGTWLVKFPPGTSEERMFDCSVARRFKLSENGKRFLKIAGH